MPHTGKHTCTHTHAQLTLNSVGLNYAVHLHASFFHRHVQYYKHIFSSLRFA